MENNFANNLKAIREERKMSQQDIADKIGIDRSAISYWESGKSDPTMGNVVKLADILKVDILSLIGGNFNFDNAIPIEMDSDTIMIPVLGTIKAGTPIEAQEDILEYVDIPRSWTRGGKKFYGLFISGDSMYPKYNEKDIVIFEQNEDMELANGKDCAVMVNGFDATFKNVRLNQAGIQLIPLNMDNNDGYVPTFYDIEQIQTLPVKIIGIAREKRTRL